jgi:hypothetical protein
MDCPRTTGDARAALFGLEDRTGSRCDNLRPGAARILLFLFAAVTISLVRAGRTAQVTQATGQVPRTAFTDSDMHALVIERLRRGEGYYDALGAELRRNGFSARPVFHWRTPAFFWALAQMRSSYVARGLLMVLTVIGLKLWIHELHLRGGRWSMISGAVFLIPLLALALDSKWVLEPEPWAAALILLSLAVYARHPGVAIACGLVALALRELVLLYVLVMLGFALRERRYREVLAWSLGIVGFFIYFGIHAWLVLKHTLPGDASDPSWLRFGGAVHVVACSRYLLLAQGPHWLNAILTVLAVTGLASRKELDRLLVVVLAYMVAFAFVGKPWNWYWGIIYLPLLAVGLGHSCAALAGLIRASLPWPSSRSQADA